MTNTLTIELPDIGDVDSVDVVEIIVSVGQRVEVESPLITLESDKATTVSYTHLTLPTNREV